jgi:hypothetical protein
MNAHSARRVSFLLPALTTAAVLAAGCSVAAPSPLSSPSAPPSESVPTSTPVTAEPSVEISAAPSPTTSPAPSATTSAAPSAAASLPSGWKSCTNSVQGFEIGYPADWYTTELNPDQVCQQFHPTEFTIPVDGEYPLTALNAVQTEYLFDPGRSGPGTSCGSLQMREPTTVGGRPAVRYEENLSGAGMYADGTRKYGYVIDRDGLEFAVFTMADPGVSTGDYAAWKAVVDEAVNTLRFP